VLNTPHRLDKHRAARRLVQAARLHAHQPILHQVDPAHTVLAGNRVQCGNHLLASELLAVECNGATLLDLDRHFFGAIRGLLR